MVTRSTWLLSSLPQQKWLTFREEDSLVHGTCDGLGFKNQQMRAFNSWAWQKLLGFRDSVKETETGGKSWRWTSVLCPHLIYFHVFFPDFQCQKLSRLLLLMRWCSLPHFWKVEVMCAFTSLKSEEDHCHLKRAWMFGQRKKSGNGGKSPIMSS